MSKGTYYPPAFGVRAFTCPHCQVYASMEWIGVGPYGSNRRPIQAAKCGHCFGTSYWFSNEGPVDVRGTMFYPAQHSAPMPHPDMPKDARQDYLEARAVMGISSKAAAALLRLSLQRLCIALGKNKKIDRAIGELVADGLPSRVQQALDTIRIIGNESVHPGEIRIEDIDLNIGKVFELMNIIVEDRITKPKELEALYQSLPESKREGVEKRDGKGKEPTSE